MVGMEELRELSRLIKKLKEKLKRLKKEKKELSRQGFTIRYVKCGKETCKKCTQGEGHGPYVYKTVREGKKVKSVYLGKPKDFEEKDREVVERLKEIDKEIHQTEEQLNYIKRTLNKLINDIS